MNLTAYSQETEPHRIDRLARIKAVMELYPDRAGPVDGLHDHKGMLTVFYSSIPDEDNMTFAREIWETLEFEPLIEFKASEELLRVTRKSVFRLIMGGAANAR